MFNCASIVIVLVIVVEYEFSHVIVTMAVNVVVNYVSQNFQCADAPAGLRMNLIFDDTCCDLIQMLVHLNVQLC